MSKEGLSEHDVEVLRRNEFQIRLAAFHDEDMEKFIELHAEEFAKLITQEPAILVEYSVNPDNAIKKASERLYH